MVFLDSACDRYVISLAVTDPQLAGNDSDSGCTVRVGQDILREEGTCFASDFAIHAAAAYYQQDPRDQSIHPRKPDSKTWGSFTHGALRRVDRGAS